LRDGINLKILRLLYPIKSVNNSLCAKCHQAEERMMKNPLDSLWGTVIAGVVLTIVLVVFANNFLIGGL
jgi:uncharacterized paraquat-inducible protein A